MNLDDARATLVQAGFNVPITLGAPQTVYFEDDSVLGFVEIFGRAEELLGAWEQRQDTFLRRHASALRAEPAKAWNVYSVFLCSAPCPPELRSQFEGVEEDFRGSRKIARADISSPSALEQALLPLLPIRSSAVLEQQDPLQVLQERLRDSPPNILKGLIGSAPPQLLATWLIEQP